MLFHGKADPEASDALEPHDKHEGHDTYAELRHDEDGLIVQIGCRTCDLVFGFIHPRAALDLAGSDSQLGEEILARFPQWRSPAS